MKRGKIPSVSATVDPEFLDNFHLLWRFGKENAGRNWAIYMEHGTCKKALIEIQKLGIPRHLSNVLVSDFKECCKFNSLGELVELDIPAIFQLFYKRYSNRTMKNMLNLSNLWLITIWSM